MQSRIALWLSRFSKRVSSSVALQEFKRRVLRELVYLLSKLDQTRSYQTTLSHATSVLPAQQHRKMRICVPLLHQVLLGASDEELTERARRYFHFLLLNGERQFLQGLDSILPGVNCFWARAPIAEKTRYKRYQMGDTRCSKTKKQCDIGKELTRVLPICRELHEFLVALPADRLTTELKNAREFLDRVVNGSALDQIHDEDACLNFGDLLIAIESASVKQFYTMNYRESQAFCEFFEQTLTVRPNNPAADEVTHTVESKPWPTLSSSSQGER